MSGEKPSVPGTVIRGADGTLYFIPDEALEHFRVTNPTDNETLGSFFGGVAEEEEDDAEDYAEDLPEGVDARHVVAPIENVIIK